MTAVRVTAAVLALLGITSLATCLPGCVPEWKYELPKPDGWEEQPAGSADVKYVSPVEGDDDDFREYVTVDGATPPGRISHPSTLASNDLHRREAELDNLKIVSSEETSIAGKSCQKVVYTFDHVGRRRKVQAYYFLFHATGLVLAGTATEESHARFAPQFEQIAQTIRFP